MFSSIRARILLLFVIGLLLILGSTVAITLLQVRGHYAELFKQRGGVAADELAQRVEKLLRLGLQPNEFYGFEAQCREIVRSHPGISHAALADADGQVLYTSSPLPPPSGPPTTSVSHAVRRQADTETIRVDRPLSLGEGLPTAHILILVDQAAVDASVNSLLTEIVSISALLILLGTGLFTVFLRLNLDQPTRALLQHIEQVDPDDIRGVPGALARRKDEIGVIAGAFDLLVNKLLRTQEALLSANDQLLSHARTLEARVKERTRELRQANRELHRLAHTDALTRLPNRLHFMTLFHQRFAHAQRHEHSFAVLLMDLDGFKGINDDYGHAAGDTALETVARRVSNAVRGGDTFSRLGGDEFALLVEEFDHPEDLQSVAEKITALVAAPFSWKGHRLELGGSIGIAVHDGSAETEAENLLQAADVAMYRAKRDRLPYAFADSGITPAMATSPRK